MKQRENWTSNIGFIMAAAGSAIGLGNIWRFPYVTGTNGGAAFLLIFIGCIVFVGFPVVVAEITIGRKTAKNPVGAFKALAPNTPWWLVGALGVLSGFVILSYYSVVAGWSMAYVFKALGGLEAGADFAGMFQDHISGFGVPLLWHAAFMLINILVISAGVVGGIQKVAKTLMPLLLLILIVLVIRSVTLPGAGEGLSFYLNPDFGAVTAQTFTDAIAQSFFTLSLGMGAMITYGSYLSKKDNVSDNAVYIILFDFLIALLAGFAIFPAVFALGFDPGAGAGLVFITLPGVLAEMPLGSLFGVLFFLLVTIAALTSSISLLEVVVAYVVDEKGWDRKKAAQTMGTIIFLVGIPTILGYSTWSGFSFLGMDVLDTYDWIANNIFLPLGGMLTAIFAGYVWKAQNLIEEANSAPGKIMLGKGYEFFLKVVAPVGIFIVMVVNIWTTITGL
ncbi:MAG: sodium-dependent transporter [Bacillota bacterium]